MTVHLEKIRECPVTATLQFVGGKWTARILWVLRRGPTTFGELCRATGASQKVMARNLRQLVDQGLITRTPKKRGRLPTVEYAYAELGRSLIPVLDVMGHWGLRELARRRAGRAA